MQTGTGPEAKFRRAFDAYFDHVNRYCLRRIPVDDVNDAVAEVFTVAWRKVDRMPDDDREMLPWLYAIARHEVSNRRRSRRRFAALKDKVLRQPTHPDPGPEPLIVRSDELDQVMAALATLSPDDRELLLLRTHEELDFAGIGTVLGCSPDAARKRLSRAMARLRRATTTSTSSDTMWGSRAITEGGDR